jgi:hypothetical protein
MSEEFNQRFCPLCGFDPCRCNTLRASVWLCPRCNSIPCVCVDGVAPPGTGPVFYGRCDTPRPDPSRAEIALAVLLKLYDAKRAEDGIHNAARIAVAQGDALLAALKGGE